MHGLNDSPILNAFRYVEHRQCHHTGNEDRCISEMNTYQKLSVNQEQKEAGNNILVPGQLLKLITDRNQYSTSDLRLFQSNAYLLPNPKQTSRGSGSGVRPFEGRNRSGLNSNGFL